MKNFLTRIFGGNDTPAALSDKRPSLYSQTVDIAMRPVIYAIKEKQNSFPVIRKKQDSFATSFFPMDDNNQGATTSRCLKAWQNPKSKLWQVQEWTYLPPACIGKETGAWKIDNVEQDRMNLCFFDALRLCAEFQLAQEKSGKQPLPAPSSREWKDIPHWREAAEAAGQACDIDGMVHPCANGQILIRGFSFFDENAVALAATSPRVEILAGSGMLVPAPHDASIDPVLLAAAGANDGALLTSAADKRRMINVYDEIIALGDRIAMGYAWGGRGNTFASLCEELNKAAAQLPAQEHRDSCYEFTKNVLANVWLRTALSFRKNNPTEAENGLPYIEKVAALQGLGSEALEKMKASYLVEELIYIPSENPEKTWGIDTCDWDNRENNRSGLSRRLKNERNRITL